MYMDRRKMMQGMAAGLGAAFGGGLVPDFAQAAPLSKSNPKRVIFFMQNQGFDLLSQFGGFLTLSQPPLVDLNYPLFGVHALNRRQ